MIMPHTNQHWVHGDVATDDLYLGAGTAAVRRAFAALRATPAAAAQKALNLCQPPVSTHKGGRISCSFVLVWSGLKAALTFTTQLSSMKRAHRILYSMYLPYSSTTCVRTYYISHGCDVVENERCDD